MSTFNIYEINVDLSEWLRSKVLSLPSILNGPLIPSLNKLKVLISRQVIGRNIDQLENQPILFQIQPDGLHPIPNIRVFLKLTQYRSQIQVIVVATQWGVWVLTNRYSQPNTYSPVLKQQLQSEVDRIHTQRFKLASGAIKQYNELDTSNLAEVGKTIGAIANLTNISTALYDWDTLINSGATNIRIPVRLFDTIPV